MIAWENFKRWMVSEPLLGPLAKPVQIEQRDGKPFCEQWDLDAPIFALPTGDEWTLADACQGTLILGANGSGKSSASADLLALKLLHLGASGLVLCVKPGEANYWQKIASLAHREKDLIRVDEKDHGFNIFDYELKRVGRGSGLTLNLVNLFRQLQDLVEANNGKKVGPDFWERACVRMISNAIRLQAALDEPFTLMAVRDIVSTAPSNIEELHSNEWEETPCGRACNGALEASEHDYEVQQAVDYFTLQVPRMGDRQRAGILETWEGLADPLLRTPLRQKFCDSTTWVPEDAIERGKIIVVDLPVKEFEIAGKMAGVIAKFMFQKAVERRPRGDERTRHPCFVWADEFQHFLTSYDPLFQQTARSSKTLSVYIGQNIPSILSALGGESSRSFMNNLLGNLVTQIFHANAETETNQYASKVIGEDWCHRQSISASESQNRLAPVLGGNVSSSASLTETLEKLVQPIEFERLRTGGTRNNRIVDAFFFQGTRIFTDGTNFMPVYFIQPQEKRT
jgi:hypothetical protein